MDNNDIHKLISYHDSWLSLDPIVGCTFNCQYCVLRKSGNSNKPPQQIYSIKDAVTELMKCKYFIRDKTPVSIGNDTDSFLPQNREYTLKLIQALEQENLKNPICISTKSEIPLLFINKMRDIKNIRLVFFISYSDLPQQIEPYTNNEVIRNNFIRLWENNFKIIHFWRPIIRQNSTKRNIIDILLFVSKYSHASVIIGLKISPELTKILKKNKYLFIPKYLEQSYGEYLLPSILKKIYAIATLQFKNYPLYRHTSCALSNVLRQSDYNGTVYKGEICLSSQCPDIQRKICYSKKSPPTLKQLRSLFKSLNLNLDFHFGKDILIIEGELKQEDYIYLRHNLNYPIQAKLIFSNIYRGSIFRESTKLVYPNIFLNQVLNQLI